MRAFAVLSHGGGAAVFSAAAALSLALAGCNQSSATNGPQPAEQRTHTGQYPIQALCTTAMVGDLVHNVGGQHVAVTTLMGESVDPHLYTASPADVAKLRRADVVFYSGLHLEGKLAELLEGMSRSKPTLAVAESLPPSRLLGDASAARDPHVWFDVSLWSEAATAVAEILSRFDPKHAADYQANAAAYRQRLAELHAYAREQLATIPREQRVLVTAHDAFQYFGRAYDVEVRGIQGISTDSEAGVRQIRELVDFLVARRIKAVFVETSVADGNIRSLLEGCAARGHSVVIGGTLYSDAMGAAGTPEGTYEGMVRHNVDTIVAALQGPNHNDQGLDNVE